VRIIFSFPSGLARLRRAKQKRKKEIGWVAFTQGGGLNGLALGYYLAALARIFHNGIKSAGLLRKIT
jgi:hypothetical protein